ncbi:MAG: PAS domain S-box protein [Alphaproteobacteria bacterium]|nr:PAS domain S-box protein [Alphaproteobacteria bacterium]
MRWFIAFAASMILGVGVFVGYQAIAERESALAEGRAAAERRATAVSEFTRRTIFPANQIASDLAQALGDRGTWNSADRARLAEISRTLWKVAPWITGIAVHDSFGRPYLALGIQPEDVGLSERFQAHLMRAGAGVVYRPAPAPVGGLALHMLASHGIRDRDNEFLGVASLEIMGSTFVGFFGALQFGPRSSVRLWSVDGKLLLSHPSFMGDPESLVAERAMVGAVDADAAGAAADASGERYAIRAVRRIDGLPLVVTMNVAEDDVLEGWHRRAGLYAFLVVGISAMIVAATALLYRLTRLQQASLSESEARLRRILDTSPSGIQIVAIDGRRLFMNRRAVEMMGYADEAAALEKHPVSSVVDREWRDRVLALAREHGIVDGMIGQRRRLDGSTFWATHDLLRIRFKDEDAFIVWIYDISRQVEAQHQAERRRLLLDTVLNAMPIPVQLRAADGPYLVVNDAYARYFGRSRREMEGRLLEEFFPTDTIIDIKRTDLQAIVAGDSITYDIAMPDGAGERRDCIVKKAAVRDENSELYAFVSAFVDVTEQRRAEAEVRRSRDAAERALQELRAAQESLVQAEKLASLGGLVAGVAHEINTPVGVALTSASHLEDETRALQRALQQGDLSQDDLDGYLATALRATRLIVGNCDRAAQLIQSFKRVAADQTEGERRSFDLDAYLREVVASLKPLLQKGRFSLDLDVPPGIELDSFPGPLSQVLTNFVTNAIAHGFRGRGHGAMRIAARPADGDQVEIRFSDDGGGIAPDVLPRVFDPFFTTNRSGGGTGLGLHIAHSIVTGRLGGRIAVESRVGAGTTFSVVLPLRAPEGAADEPAAAIAASRS